MTSIPFTRGRTLVVAFEGWNDAGEAATGAVRKLRDHLEVDPVAEIDPEDYVDFQFSRPVVAVEDGVRRIVWPTSTFYAPTGGGGVHLLLGTEPSRAWRSFVREVVEFIDDREIEVVVLLGAMLADVPHSRPITTVATSEHPEVQEAFGIDAPAYEGPTGILGVLAVELASAGLPTVSLWASVPHYVHNAPSPKATLALLDRLREFVDVDVPREALVEEAAAWESGIDELAEDDDEMASYIKTLERARDTADETAIDGDAIAEEFERYLRRRSDD